MTVTNLNSRDIDGHGVAVNLLEVVGHVGDGGLVGRVGVKEAGRGEDLAFGKAIVRRLQLGSVTHTAKLIF